MDGCFDVSLSLSSLFSLLLFAIKQVLLLTRVQDSFFPFPFLFFCIDLVVTETDAAALAAFAAAFAADLVGVLLLQTLRIPRLRERSQRSWELRAALVNMAPIKATSNGRREGCWTTTKSQIEKQRKTLSEIKSVILGEKNPGRSFWWWDKQRKRNETKRDGGCSCRPFDSFVSRKASAFLSSDPLGSRWRSRWRFSLLRHHRHQLFSLSLSLSLFFSFSSDFSLSFSLSVANG